MTAKIEIYDDNGNFINKYEIPPIKECIDCTNDYEIHKYHFNFIYAECVPKWREEINV